ncbi:MAG: membrane protein insertase YidC [Oscillospiraceae bacterium]|nr:membrane protein insertase YidC [Oscillospiraceae bacterium]
MFNAIAKPFGILLLWLYNLVGNYGIAIFLFAVVVKVILLPFQMKSKKSMMRMNRLQPRVKELEKAHGGNQQKYQQEVSKLYKEEGVNPMSGCIWSLIPFPILIALYQAIRYPLTTMMRVPKELVEAGGAIAQKLEELGFSTTLNDAYIQLAQSQFISENWEHFAGLSERLVNINYNFIGLSLGQMPKWNFFMSCDWSDVSNWLPALGLFLIPIVSALLSWLQMKASQKMNPQTGNEATNSTMKGMNLMMPLMSLYIGFIMPAALGMYWIFTSVLGFIQEVILNAYFKKVMAKEDAERLERARLRDAELERKRQETEALREKGETVRNSNTSKKKMQARQKAELDEIKAAAVREERAARRARLGIEEEEIPESQVGNRRYARGRAYVADRYSHPETAEEKTAAAAAESEFGESIDETVEVVETVETVEATPNAEEVIIETEAEVEETFEEEFEEDDEQ